MVCCDDFVKMNEVMIWFAVMILWKWMRYNDMVGSDDFDMVDGKMKQSTILKICF